MREAWGSPCTPRLGKFVFWTGIPISIDERYRQAYVALDAILKAWNYVVRSDTWGYNCRKITGGTGYSLHAWALPPDVNSITNPYGPRLVTDMPRDMVEAILAVRTMGGQQVWGWGGNYRGNKDAMHFDPQAFPSEIAQGIDWATVRRPGANMPGRFPNCVAEVRHPLGTGFWLVASDGGVANFKGAPFHGSMGGHPLNAPIVDLVPTPDGNGYWLIGADGGLFAFGSAPAYNERPYEALQQEYARGERAIVGGDWEAPSWLVLRADDGSEYRL